MAQQQQWQSGTTACIALLLLSYPASTPPPSPPSTTLPDRVFVLVANIGDSRALLCSPAGDPQSAESHLTAPGTAHSSAHAQIADGADPSIGQPGIVPVRFATACGCWEETLAAAAGEGWALQAGRHNVRKSGKSFPLPVASSLLRMRSFLDAGQGARSHHLTSDLGVHLQRACDDS